MSNKTEVHKTYFSKYKRELLVFIPSSFKDLRLVVYLYKVLIGQYSSL